MITNMKHFRFWCQKVIPLVYDNSLSYYEILCKVVNYLNGVIDDINQIPEYIDEKVKEAFDEEHIMELISEVFKTLEDAITNNNEGVNTNFSKDYPNLGTLLWHDNKLYKTIRVIDQGDAVIVDTNIELVDFADMFNDFITEVKENFTPYDDGLRETASANRTVHTLIWLDDDLYEVTKPITEGNAYIYSGENQNVAEITMDGIYNYLLGLIAQEIEDRTEAISAEAEARESADETLGGLIDDEATAREHADLELSDLIASEVRARASEDDVIKALIGDLDELHTEDKDSVVDAINELDDIIANLSTLNVINVVTDIGCKNDGSADCAAAINEYLANDTSGRPLLFPYGTYKINDTVNISHRDVYILGQVFTRSDITMFRLTSIRTKFIFNKLGYSNSTDIKSTDASSAVGTAIEIIPDGDVCYGIDIIGNYIMCDTGIKFTNTGNGFIQNINIKVDYFLNRTNCIKAQSDTGKWINEIIFNGCAFNCYANTDDAILIQLHETTHNNLMNGWRFIGCAFENYNTVFLLEAAKVYLTNCRMSRHEGFSASSSKYIIGSYSSTFNIEGNVEFANVDQNFTLDSSVEGIITGYINNNGVVGSSCKVVNDGTNQFAFIDQGAYGKAFNHSFTANNQTISCGYGFDLSKGVEINVGAYTGCTVNVVYNNNYRPAAGSDGGYYTGFRPFIVTVTGTASVTLGTPNAIGGGTTHTLAGGTNYLITRNKTIALS